MQARDVEAKKLTFSVEGEVEKNWSVQAHGFAHSKNEKFVWGDCWPQAASLVLARVTR